MTWQGTTEHEALHSVATSLVAGLRDLESWLLHGDTEYIFHSDSAARCRSLGTYIGSALADAERDAYAPALALMRSAMEHVFIDKLVFLGQRYVQIFRYMDEETWAKWQQAREAGEAWTLDITKWSRTRKGEVRVTREGLHSKPAADGSQQTIGIHYFLLNEYSPFVGPPSIQEYFDDGLSETDERREYAERNKSMYEVYLKWSSIKESLKANGFAEEETLRRLDVHYRFLSAFVHPNTDVTKLLYGRNAWNWPMYDHYSSELILLYAIVFAVEELRNFRAMAQRQPFAEVNNWIETERLCDRAWRLSSHLWFPGQEPHAHDRYQEANRRGFREQRSGSVRRLENPAALPVEEVGYYVNPLERLVELHASKREMMTGLSYVSSWPRSDAHLR
jgi:hypothetical protein